MIDNPMQIPALTTSPKCPLHQLEKQLLNHAVRIEGWFREQWHKSANTVLLIG